LQETKNVYNDFLHPVD